MRDGVVCDDGAVAANARVAQLVEHTLGKGEVIGSIPIASSEHRASDRGGAGLPHHAVARKPTLHTLGTGLVWAKRNLSGRSRM